MTTFGTLVRRFHAATYKVHEQVAAQGLGGGEVGLATAQGAYLLDELHEGEVLRERMKVLIMMCAALAAGDLFQGFGDDERVEAEGVLVDAAVGESERAGLAVGDHDDLLHVLILFGKDALERGGDLRGVLSVVGGRL